MKINQLINKFYFNPLFSRLFPTQIYCLKQALKDCTSVLDLGCGPSSPLQHCKNITHSLGVDTFKPYLAQSKYQKIHTKYLNTRLEKLKLAKKSFDAIILIDVLEHLSKTEGKKILKMANLWAGKKIIIVTPNGYHSQQKFHHNPNQQHLSGWTIDELSSQGYQIHGLAGLKKFRRPTNHQDNHQSLLSPIKLKPKLFWLGILTLSQAFTYQLPQFAFSLFCVKNLRKK